jgi:hypothetical protein
MDRREFTAAILFGMIAAAIAGLDPAIAVAQAANQHPGASSPTNTPRLQIGALSLSANDPTVSCRLADPAPLFRRCEGL